MFATREKAIRISAARMIKDMRNWRFVNKHEFYNSDKMDRETMEEVINWTRQIVAKECKAAKLPTPITMPPPPLPPPVPTGLELIDYINKKDFEEGKHRAKAQKENNK